MLWFSLAPWSLWHLLVVQNDSGPPITQVQSAREVHGYFKKVSSLAWLMLETEAAAIFCLVAFFLLFTAMGRISAEILWKEMGQGKLWVSV